MNIDKSVFIADGAKVMGDVTLGAGVNVWFNAVIRADAGPVVIGEGTNVQDNCVIHNNEKYPVHIGKGVTIGHGAIVHGSVVHDNVMIGMGAITMNGCEIGENSIIAAGAVVTQNMKIPANSLVVGCPGVVKKQVTGEQAAANQKNAAHYVELGQKYKSGEMN